MTNAKQITDNRPRKKTFDLEKNKNEDAQRDIDDRDEIRASIDAKGYSIRQ